MAILSCVAVSLTHGLARGSVVFVEGYNAIVCLDANCNSEQMWGTMGTCTSE
jgi:hypothetical protein